jgi:hypothetical protein
MLPLFSSLTRRVPPPPGKGFRLPAGPDFAEESERAQMCAWATESLITTALSTLLVHFPLLTNPLSGSVSFSSRSSLERELDQRTRREEETAALFRAQKSESVRKADHETGQSD